MTRTDERPADRPSSGTAAVGGRRRLTFWKHEGAGNDFLVALDPAGKLDLGPDHARALCDRHRGVGADGLIVVGRDGVGADLTMVLWNADGSQAEMSGNGMRCLAQAAVAAGLVTPPRFTVATGAGVRAVELTSDDGQNAVASVDMGPVRLGTERSEGGPGRRSRAVDVGNPHLVVLSDGDPAGADLAGMAAGVAARCPGGVNVELVAPGPGPGQLVMRVWERGVGETLACGTGSCAAAAAARSWGMVGDRVLVANPGGTLDVRLGAGDGAPAVLAGPVRRVAEVLVDAAALEAVARR
ncbi:MAG: diaminopimelate epimerase [Acidimicrobiales bacterium]